jgi:predicted phosphodiesterase
MRIAALCDIHGNLRALEAVLAELDAYAPDRILVGGDVALGPMPHQTLELLASLGERVVYLRGNCDREMVAALDGEVPDTSWGARTRWAAERCTAAQMKLLASLPTTLAFDIDRFGETLFCHGSPRRDDEIITKLSSATRRRATLEGTSHVRVVHAHTHVQYDHTVDGTRWICPGSVGIPYEKLPGARWAMFGPDVTLRRTPYDVERFIADVRASDFPDAEQFIAKYLLESPDPDEVSAFFESLANGARVG